MMLDMEIAYSATFSTAHGFFFCWTVDGNKCITMKQLMQNTLIKQFLKEI